MSQREQILALVRRTMNVPLGDIDGMRLEVLDFGIRTFERAIPWMPADERFRATSLLDTMRRTYVVKSASEGRYGRV